MHNSKRDRSSEYDVKLKLYIIHRKYPPELQEHHKKEPRWDYLDMNVSQSVVDNARERQDQTLHHCNKKEK